jgi:hypothetical protein
MFTNTFWKVLNRSHYVLPRLFPHGVMNWRVSLYICTDMHVCSSLNSAILWSSVMGLWRFRLAPCFVINSTFMHVCRFLCIVNKEKYTLQSKQECLLKVCWYFITHIYSNDRAVLNCFPKWFPHLHSYRQSAVFPINSLYCQYLL